MEGRTYDELRKLGWTAEQIWWLLSEQSFENETETEIED